MNNKLHAGRGIKDENKMRQWITDNNGTVKRERIQPLLSGDMTQFHFTVGRMTRLALILVLAYCAESCGSYATEPLATCTVPINPAREDDGEYTVTTAESAVCAEMHNILNDLRQRDPGGDITIN